MSCMFLYGHKNYDFEKIGLVGLPVWLPKMGKLNSKFRSGAVVATKWDVSPSILDNVDSCSEVIVSLNDICEGLLVTMVCAFVLSLASFTVRFCRGVLAWVATHASVVDMLVITVDCSVVKRPVVAVDCFIFGMELIAAVCFLDVILLVPRMSVVSRLVWLINCSVFDMLVTFVGDSLVDKVVLGTDSSVLDMLVAMPWLDRIDVVGWLVIGFVVSSPNAVVGSANIKTYISKGAYFF